MTPSHSSSSSSSDLSGIVGMALLEQVDTWQQGSRREGTRPGQKICTLICSDVVMVLLLRGGASLTCEVGLVMPTTVSKAFWPTACASACYAGRGTGRVESHNHAGNSGREQTLLCRNDCGASRREIGDLGMSWLMT